MDLASGSYVRQRQHRSENLVQVPSSSDDCTNLFMQCLNETNSEKKQQQELLLQYINQAAERNRHPFQAFVMLIGSSGDGKSSTINHLMNAEMIATSDTASITRSVTEYSRVCNVPELGLKGLRMSIIDTPGFNDTSGQQQDACNLWAIRKFCDKYLNTAKILAYPNIILLCVKATENRFQGDKSSFVKNLEILEAMRIIDRRHINIVLVLTNACAMPTINWEEKISIKAKDINETLKNKLGFYARVVYIENDFENIDLQAVSDGTLLPNGEIQPHNLFLTIMQQLEDNGDQLGQSTLRQIYNDWTMKQQFHRRNSIPAKIFSKSGGGMNEDENQFLLILQDISGESKCLNELRAEYEKLHEENLKSKKLQAEHEQIVKQMMEAAEQKQKNMASQVEQVLEDNATLRREQKKEREELEEIRERRQEQFRDEMRRMEEKFRQSLETRQEQFQDEMRRREEVLEKDRKQWAYELKREREQMEEREQHYRDQQELMRKKREKQHEKEMEEMKEKIRQMKSQVVPGSQSQPICTSDSRQQTTQKTNWYEHLFGMAKNLVVNGLLVLADRFVPGLRPGLQAITAGNLTTVDHCLD